MALIPSHFFSVRLMVSSSNRKLACGIFSKSRQRNVVMCEKQVFWNIYMWKTRGQVSEWWITSGIWICLKRNEAQVCVLCCVKETHSLTDKGSTVGAIHTQRQACQTLYYCVRWDKLGGSWTRIRATFSSGEMALKPPFLETLWSIHPVMNEVAVNGGKAGVGSRLCLWEYPFLNSVCVTEFSVSLLRT